MGYIVFGICAGIVLTIVFAVWGNYDCELHNIIAIFLAIIFGITTGGIYNILFFQSMGLASLRI